jgi:hypothetical protein
MWHFLICQFLYFVFVKPFSLCCFFVLIFDASCFGISKRKVLLAKVFSFTISVLCYNLMKNSQNYYYGKEFSDSGVSCKSKDYFEVFGQRLPRACFDGTRKRSSKVEYGN